MDNTNKKTQWRHFFEIAANEWFIEKQEIVNPYNKSFRWCVLFLTVIKLNIKVYKS